MTSRVPSYICKTAINQTLTFLMSRPLRVFRAHLISIFLWCTFAAALHLLLRPKTWLLFCYVLLKEIPYFACLRPTSSGGISFQKGEIKHQQFWPSKSYFCGEEAYFASWRIFRAIFQGLLDFSALGKWKVWPVKSAWRSNVVSRQQLLDFISSII